SGTRPAPALIIWTIPGPGGVPLPTSPASGDEVGVLAAAVPLNLDLNGVGTVNVGMGDAQAILAPVCIGDSVAGAVSVAVDDSLDTTPRMGTLTTSPSASGGGGDGGKGTRLGPAPLCSAHTPTASNTG